LATWSSGLIEMGGGAVLHNLAGATFDAKIDDSISNAFSGTATFTNDGTFTKSAGSGTTTIQVTFNNNRTVTVSSGTLRLTRDGTTSATGSISVTTGTAVDFGSTT